jgi:hypothetical protein
VTSASGDAEGLALTDFQVRVAQLFFSLPAAQSFLLAGGAALVAQHLTTRPTQDLDFFTRVGATSVPAARDALEIAAQEQGWSIERIRDEATFCRLIIHGADDLLVDLALDAPPQQPATASLIGPTFAPEELAGARSWPCSTEPRPATLLTSWSSQGTSPKMTFCNRPPWSIPASTSGYLRRCSAASPDSATRTCPPPKRASQR